MHDKGTRLRERYITALEQMTANTAANTETTANTAKATLAVVSEPVWAVSEVTHMVVMSGSEPRKELEQSGSYGTQLAALDTRLVGEDSAAAELMEGKMAEVEAGLGPPLADQMTALEARLASAEQENVELTASLHALR
jgi:hypothetical protein